MKIKPLVVALSAAMSVAVAQAAALDLLPGGPTGAKPTDSSLTLALPGASGSGTLDFQLAGFASLDGVNFYEDDFSLYVGGVLVFKGSFDMGGGGTNTVMFNPNGASATPTTFGLFAGGKTDISIPITWSTPGDLVFSYASLPGPDHAGFQGLGDEGWGLNSATLTTAVPEPETYALMLAGLGAVGAVARRRSR